MAEQHHHGHTHADGQTHAHNEHAHVHADGHQHHHAHDDGHSHAHGHDHGHSHGHGHGHGHGHDYAASNREFSDNIAANYEEQPLVKELCANISQAFLKEYPFEKEKTRVLDFACGSGLISRNVFPYAREVIGVDISQGMLNVYTRNAQRAGISPEALHAININLLEDGNTEASEEAVEQLGGKFDVIVCSMAYHHFPSIQAATSVLASLLNPGGKLLVSDGDRNQSPTPSDGDTLHSSITSPTPQPFHPSNFFDDKKFEFKKEEVIPHDFGVMVETMKEVFEAAGLRDVSVKRRVKVEGTTVGDVKAQTAYLLVASGVKT